MANLLPEYGYFGVVCKKKSPSQCCESNFLTYCGQFLYPEPKYIPTMNIKQLEAFGGDCGGESVFCEGNDG